MMKRRILLCASLILLAVFLAACGPDETQSRSPEAASAPPLIIESSPTGIASEALPSATPPATVQAVATSRGPNLEATDPRTVSMAAGGLQFVEFFEFW